MTLPNVAITKIPDTEPDAVPGLWNATYEEIDENFGDHESRIATIEGKVANPSSVVQGDLLYGSAANTLSSLTKSGTANQFLKNSGTNNNPAWASIAAGDLPTAIDAAKIANGDVSNTEFQYLDGVTSGIQSQLSAKVNNTGDETIAGVKTFSSFPLTPSSAPTTDYQVANMKYVKDTMKVRGYYSNLYVAHKAVTGLNSVNCVVNASAKTFTRASGSWLTDGFAIGDGILTYGFSNAGNNSYFIISNVDATVITCSAATGLVNETGASTGFWCCNRDKITADCAVLRDSSGNLKSYETISVTIDMSTTGANALDTGTFTAATWYYKYLIGKSDGTIAGLASTSATSPTLPSGYTYFLRVSAAYAVTGVRFYPFMQSGQVFYYIGPESGVYSPPGYYATTTANLTDRTAFVAVAVPPIALEMLGTFNPSATVCYASLCWDSNFQRGFYNVLHPTDVTYTSQHGPWWYPLNPASPQTVYIRNPLGAMSYLFRGYKLPI